MNKAHLTAISRSKPSAPMARLAKADRLNGRNMLDFGCGKGYDADYFGMDKYDPYYFNRDLCTGDYDVITCNYVLNVIANQADRDLVIAEIYRLLQENGIAYITVRRDVKTAGYTSKGTYQESIQLNLPILWENSSFCTYMLIK